MAKRLQLRGGTTSQHSSFTGAIREVTVDTDKDTLVVHDGSTAGGFPLATATNFKSTGIDDNATSTAITIDSSERVGINKASPSTPLHITKSSLTGFVSRTSSTLTLESSGGTEIYLASPDSSYGQIRFGDTASTYSGGIQYEHNANHMLFQVNSTERMRITSDGSVAIGSTTAQAKLHIVKNDAGALNDGNSNMLMLENTTATGMAIGSSNSGEGHIYFSDSDDADVGTISYFHSDNSLRFRVNASEPMRIDSSGNVYIGKTSGILANVGHEFNAGSYASHTRDGDVVLFLNRKSSNGKIQEFRKDNTAFGSIGVVNNDNPFFQGNATNHGGLQCGTNTILPCKNSANADNTLDLGQSDIRWKDIYLSGGAFIGGTGTANKLEDYEEGTWTATVGIGTVNSLYGKYTKIGDKVFCSVAVSSFSNRSTATSILINGLPFASKTGLYTSTAAGMHRYVNTGNGGDTVGIYLTPNATYFQLYQCASNSNWNNVRYDHLSNLGAEFYFNFTYLTN